MLPEEKAEAGRGHGSGLLPGRNEHLVAVDVEPAGSLGRHEYLEEELVSEAGLGQRLVLVYLAEYATFQSRVHLPRKKPQVERRDSRFVHVILIIQAILLVRKSSFSAVFHDLPHELISLQLQETLPAGLFVFVNPSLLATLVVYSTIFVRYAGYGPMKSSKLLQKSLPSPVINLSHGGLVSQDSGLSSSGILM